MGRCRSLLGVAILGFFVAGCSASSSVGGGGDATGSDSSGSGSEGIQVVVGETPDPSAYVDYFESASGEVLGEATASVEGVVDGSLTVQVLGLEVAGGDTAVRLNFVTSEKRSVAKRQWLAGDFDELSTSPLGVALSSDSAGKRWYPLEAEDGTDAAGATDYSCICGFAPSVLGPDGVQMSVMFPEIPEGVTEVSVEVPGFDAIDVPVTRS